MKQSGAQYGAPALTEREQLALQKAEEFDTQILQPRLEKTLKKDKQLLILILEQELWGWPMVEE